MNTEIIFKRLDYGKNAHAIYEALLQSKSPLLIAQISDKIEIVRPEIYRNLKKLTRDGVVKEVSSGKRTAYKAGSPKVIEALFSQNTKDVSLYTEKVLRKQKKELPEHIRYFKGFSGIRAVFDDAIQHTPKGETFYRYTSEKDLASVNKYLSPNYRTLRDKKKLNRLVISNPVSGKQKKSRLERFIKYIPQEFDVFDQNIIQLTYGNRIAFINLSKEEAFIIEDKMLADFQKVIFKMLYRKI